MPQDGKCHHGAAVLLALIVGALTLTCTSRAIQATTTPNEALASYSLVAGANSAAITPVANVPVHVAGTCITGGVRGVGQVVLLRIPSSFLEWSGLGTTSSSSSAPNLEGGYSATPGAHICWIDWIRQCDIQVNSADSFRVHNGSSVSRTGYVSLIW